MDVSEEHVASIFRAEEYAKQKMSIVAYFCSNNRSVRWPVQIMTK
jgi:hypothetical protein